MVCLYCAGRRARSRFVTAKMGNLVSHARTPQHTGFRAAALEDAEDARRVRLDAAAAAAVVPVAPIGRKPSPLLPLRQGSSPAAHLPVGQMLLVPAGQIVPAAGAGGHAPLALAAAGRR